MGWLMGRPDLRTYNKGKSFVYPAILIVYTEGWVEEEQRFCFPSRNFFIIFRFYLFIGWD